MEIRLLEPTQHDFTGYTLLLSQLSSQYSSITFEEFKNIYNNMPKNNFIYLYCLDKEICATIKIVIEQKFYNNNCYIGYIEDVVVLDKHRKMNIGTKLVQFAIDKCKEFSCYKIKLTCSSHNTDFYLKNGFIEDGHNMIIKGNS